PRWLDSADCDFRTIRCGPPAGRKGNATVSPHGPRRGGQKHVEGDIRTLVPESRLGYTPPTTRDGRETMAKLAEFTVLTVAILSVVTADGSRTQSPAPEFYEEVTTLTPDGIPA